MKGHRSRGREAISFSYLSGGRNSTMLAELAAGKETAWLTLTADSVAPLPEGLGL